MFSSCGLDSQGKECVTDVGVAVQSRLDFLNSDFSSFDEYKDNISKGINAELEILSKYRSVNLKDNNLNDIIKEYVSSLEEQQKGINYMLIDADKYNDLYIENGINVSRRCLLTLKDDYNLNIDVDYEEAFDDFLNSEPAYLIKPEQKTVVNTENGEVEVSFISSKIVTNPAGEKEFVLLCDVKNISYSDDWNPSYIDFNNFIRVNSGDGYTLPDKSEAYDVVDGYEAVAGAFGELKENEKKKFAIIYSYIDDMDICYVEVFSSSEKYGCYLSVEK